MELDAAVAPAEEQRFFASISRRLAREPVQYIVGYTEFFGHRFNVDPSVLIPRPETELLVEETLRLVRGRSGSRVMDVGTGSGCIAISVKLALPKSDVIGVDVSRAALETAKRNARSLDAAVSWLEYDMKDASLVVDIVERFGERPVNVLVSNPPYVPPDERESIAPEISRYEPEIALFTGEDSVAPYRTLAAIGSDLLTAGGAIVLEIHEERSNDVCAVLNGAGYTDVVVHRDRAGRERMVTGKALK